MKTIYTIICLLYMVSCINAGEVWVVSQKGLSDDRQPKKVVWVVTQKPSKVSKVCECSNQCVCGCNQGKECDCNQSGHNADMNRDRNPDKMSGFEIIRPQPDRIATCNKGTLSHVRTIEPYTSQPCVTGY